MRMSGKTSTAIRLIACACYRGRQIKAVMVQSGTRKRDFGEYRGGEAKNAHTGEATEKGEAKQMSVTNVLTRTQSNRVTKRLLPKPS